MRHVLLDVNIVLDVLLDRNPHSAAASHIWSSIEMGRAEGLLSAHAVTTIHYLNTRSTSAAMASDTTDALLSVFDVAPVDEHVLREAAAWAGGTSKTP